jgi:YggT family protein
MTPAPPYAVTMRRLNVRCPFQLLLLPLFLKATDSFDTLNAPLLSATRTSCLKRHSLPQNAKGAATRTRCHLFADASLATDAIMTSSSFVSNTLIIAETEPWVQPLASVLDPFLNFMSFAMLTRVVLSWYPTMNVKEMPWILVVLPTEPLLRSVRGVVPPAFGVDITPIVWLGVFTFIHEILLGQQGLLILKLQYGI